MNQTPAILTAYCCQLLINGKYDNVVGFCSSFFFIVAVLNEVVRTTPQYIWVENNCSVFPYFFSMPNPHPIPISLFTEILLNQNTKFIKNAAAWETKCGAFELQQACKDANTVKASITEYSQYYLKPFASSLAKHSAGWIRIRNKFHCSVHLSQDLFFSMMRGKRLLFFLSGKSVSCVFVSCEKS